MVVYVMNTIVLPIDFEKYPKVTVRIRKTFVEEVRQLLSQGFVSAVGHEATSILLTQLIGVEVPYNRITVKLKPGDVCVHFVLKERIPEGKVLSYEELQKLQFDLAISEVLEHE